MSAAPALQPLGLRARGFSLIELMVVVAVMAILATIAIASYRRYAMRANRTEARMALLSIQAAQEKFFLQNNQYAQDIPTVVNAPPAGLGVPLSNAGATTGGNYIVSFVAATANTYQVQATATGTQANDTPACLTFSIDQSGNRLPVDSTGCWR